GNWSDGTVWSLGAAPTACNTGTVVVGTTVTIDTDGIASTTTINGKLTFSRVVNSTLTLVGGNMTVAAGGTLDMGTSADPISVSSATLILASGTIGGQYNLTINNGGNFLVYGAA